MRRVGSILPRRFPWCRRACSPSFNGPTPSSITSRATSLVDTRLNGINKLSSAAESRQGVEDLLHVVVLLEFVDQAQNLGCFGLGKLDRHGADVLVLGGERRNAPPFESFLQPAEIIEGAANHQLRLALVPGAVAHLFQTVVDQIQLELVLILDAAGV